jgi:peptide-methionine (S)-S-oxide reductase
MTDPNQSAALETTILAGGCFWCLDAVFRDVEGVHSVVPGYCGGTVDDPQYRDVCDGGTGHAEAVRIEFDPAVVSYRDLLEIFFVIHDPTTLNRQGNDIGTQYRSAIFPADEAQLHAALSMIEELGEHRVFPSAIVTRVEQPGVRFWPAEEVHHDFFRHNPDQPYCQYVVAPKIAKFRQKFARLRRKP